MTEEGLISVEYTNQTKTMTFVYEPTAGYLIHDVIEFAEDVAKLIMVYEGDRLAWHIRSGEDGWDHVQAPT